MYAVATFLVVAVLTLAFTRLATGALIATGLPPEIASFQARSAFSGAGFTTTEAENVVNHPTRRRIIATTMLVGNLGTPTLVLTVLAGFLIPGPGSTLERSMLTFSGILLIILLVANKPVQALLSRVGQKYTSSRLLPRLQEGYEELATLGDDFVVGVLRLAEDPDPTSRSLRGLNDAFPDLEVLGVRQNGRFYGESPIDVELHSGDEIILFGRRDVIAEHNDSTPT